MTFIRQPSPEEILIRTRIGRNIQKARHQAGISLSEAAKRLRYSKSKLSEIENGKKGLDVVMEQKMADLYLVSVAYFHTGEESDIGEEHLANYNAVCVEIMQAGNKIFAEMCRQAYVAAVPNEKPIQDLLDSSENTIRIFRHIISINNELWEEMKGGNKLTTAINNLERRHRHAKDTYKKVAHAKKIIHQEVQLSLPIQE